jgi:hypothetical protein
MPAKNRVSAAQIKALQENYLKKIHAVRKDGSIKPVNRKEDTMSIWFSKDAIDELFVENGYTPGAKDFGLRIYIGVHDKETILTDIPDHNHGKLMTVLVATKGPAEAPVDLLESTGTSLKTAATADEGGGTGGGGLNHGKICPPDICGGVQ